MTIHCSNAKGKRVGKQNYPRHINANSSKEFRTYSVRNEILTWTSKKRTSTNLNSLEMAERQATCSDMTNEQGIHKIVATFTLLITLELGVIGFSQTWKKKIY